MGFLFWLLPLVPFSIVAFMWFRQSALRDNLGDFADKHDLDFLETGWFGFNMTGRYRGHDIELNRAMKQVGNRTSWKLQLEYSVGLDVDLTEDFVIRDWLWHRYYGVDTKGLEVVTQHTEFDSKFAVESTDRAAAYDVLDDDELRERLLEHQASANIFKLQPTSRFVQFDGAQFGITQFRIPFSAESIIDRLDEVIDTAELLEQRLREHFPTDDQSVRQLDDTVAETSEARW